MGSCSKFIYILEVSPASPRPREGSGWTSTGSLNCSPCQEEDFSPIQKSQKKNVSQGPENSSYKGPGSKYFRLCRPHGLECVLEPKMQPWRTHTRLGVAASGKILLTKTGVFCWALALGVRLWDFPKENNCSYSIELFFYFLFYKSVGISQLDDSITKPTFELFLAVSKKQTTFQGHLTPLRNQTQ